MNTKPNHRKRSAAGLSRRTFLKTSAAVAAAAWSGPLISMAAPKGVAAGGNALNVALIGNGTRGGQDKDSLNGKDARLIAICDVDASKAKGGAGVNGYTDYRKMLETEKTLDAVIIATCDHWHAPLSKAFMLAGKHVYCEKPLTRTVAESIELQALQKTCKVATQLGNQGSASTSFRRGVEVIQAGGIGQVHEVYGWRGEGGWPHDVNIPQDADPIPADLNWDFWCGPSVVHPYKKTIYHPYQWRGWYDYGTGQIGNFGTHTLALAAHALRLPFPDKIELLSPPGNRDSSAKVNEIRYNFAARKDMDACTMTWYDGNAAKSDLPAIKDVKSRLGNFGDCLMIIGEKGFIHANSWDGNVMIKLDTDAQLTDILRHTPTAGIPVTEPRTRGHMEEWIEAAKTGSPTYSNFDTGGQLGQLIAAGSLTMRMGKTLEFDPTTRQCKDAEAMAKYYGPAWRKDYTVGGPGGDAGPATMPAAAAAKV